MPTGTNADVWGEYLNSNADITDEKIREAIQGSATVAAAMRAIFLRIRPAGELAIYAGATVPFGWLPCDGRWVSRTGYAALFGAIGTRYGAGDGFTNFTLPDFRGNAIAGADSIFGSGSSGRLGLGLGGMGGANAVALTEHHLPAHTHGAWTSADGWHNHAIHVADAGQHNHPNGFTNVTGAHTHTYERAVSNGFAGGSGGAVAVTGGAETSGNGDHGHAVYLPDAGQHVHVASSDGSGTHGHTITVAAAGGGNAFGIVQPTLAVNVMIWTGIFE
jgi:microcystin-dependent protein